MRIIRRTSRFKTDLKKIKRSGKYPTEEIYVLIGLLSRDEPLAEKYKNHILLGEYTGCCELHIRPDWLLVYRLKPGTIELVRTGSHSELFG